MSTILNPTNPSDIDSLLQEKIDLKTKPQGALGQLEQIAKKIGVIQKSLSPTLTRPHILVFAGDHGIAANKEVSNYPQEVTYQMVLNFLSKGAAINVFCDQHGIELLVIDAGVRGTFDTSSDMLLHQKIRESTTDYSLTPAMTMEELTQSIDMGRRSVKGILQSGCNVVGFGEMGIGNTSSAALLMHCLTDIPLEQCVGRGTGLRDDRLQKKLSILQQVLEHHGTLNDPSQVLMTYGGFEIAQQVGAMLEAAEQGMIILIDGFITTSALLVASKMSPGITEYCLASHQSDEAGHQKMLASLGLEPILKLDMRLGEGTGCALAYPLILSSINFLNQMASFASAGVTKTELD